MRNTPETPLAWSPRLVVVLLIAISVSLPMAWISLAKVTLFLFGLGYLIAGQFVKPRPLAWHSLWTARTILLIVLAFACSLLWTEVDQAFALHAFVKHAKLLEILLVILLLQTEREARLAVTVYAAGQIFVILCSWLLALDLALPWVINSQTFYATKYVVFAESYLDQSIMLACTAAVLWHLRAQFLPWWLASFIAVAALLDIFLLLQGRTGYVIALAMVTLAAIWSIRPRWRMPALIAIPIVLVVGLYFSPGKLHERVFQVVNETQAYSQQAETNSSSGWRLNAWHRSVQAIQARPWNGFGVGSWAPVVKRLEGNTGDAVFGTSNSSNPHQEYLLWGVEIGIGGILLALALFASVVWDVRKFETGIRRATLSVLAAIAIACLFNSAIFDDLMGDFLCVSLGLLMALGLHAHPGKEASK